MTASSDPSLRFVLADEHPYPKNLAALWAIEPKLARRLEALSPSDHTCQVEPSKSGEPTVKLVTPDGRSIYLHSRYQPTDEARRLVEFTTSSSCSTAAATTPCYAFSNPTCTCFGLPSSSATSAGLLRVAA
jgi:hypothetical protein